MKKYNNNENEKYLSKSQKESSNKEDDNNKNNWKKSQIVYNDNINPIEQKDKMNQTERKNIYQEENLLKALDNNKEISLYNASKLIKLYLKMK